MKKGSDINSSSSSAVSSDEGQIIGKEVTEDDIKVGTYMHVKFKAGGRRNLVYRYADVAQMTFKKMEKLK